MSYLAENIYIPSKKIRMLLPVNYFTNYPADTLWPWLKTRWTLAASDSSTLYLHPLNYS